MHIPFCVSTRHWTNKKEKMHAKRNYKHILSQRCKSHEIIEEREEENETQKKTDQAWDLIMEDEGLNQ